MYITGSHLQHSQDALVALPCFGHTLITPSRGDKRHNIVQTIKKRVETCHLELAAGIPFTSPSNGLWLFHKHQKRWSDANSIAGAVLSKLKAWDIRVADGFSARVIVQSMLVQSQIISLLRLCLNHTSTIGSTRLPNNGGRSDARNSLSSARSDQLHGGLDSSPYITHNCLNKYLVGRHL